MSDLQTREQMLNSLPTNPQAAATHYRHKKRGTTYEVIGVAELQVSADMLCDGSAMVVYRGADGKLWVREEGEFHDGRFEAQPSSEHGRGDVEWVERFEAAIVASATTPCGVSSALQGRVDREREAARDALVAALQPAPRQEGEISDGEIYSLASFGGDKAERDRFIAETRATLQPADRGDEPEAVKRFKRIGAAQFGEERMFTVAEGLEVIAYIERLERGDHKQEAGR